MPVTFGESTVVEELEAANVPPVLDPDHPLLARFQEALKQHLLKQIAQLKNEAYEMEVSAKHKNIECERLGVEAYEAQQLVNQQHKDLEKHIVELDEICGATEELEQQIEKNKKVLEERYHEVFEAEKKDLRLRKEIEGMSSLLRQMKEWEDDIESELMTNQRVFEKTKKDKIKLAEEKRQLDMLVYKLMTEVWRLEEELETLDMQLRVKEEEREKLAEAVVASNIDMDSMNCELKCIINSWNSVIVATSQRDRHYNSIKEELEKLNEKLTIMQTEYVQLQKLCTKETVQNQRLTEIKERIEADIENTKLLMQAEMRKRDVLEAEMAEKQILIDQIEYDCKKVVTENACLKNELSLVVKIFEKIVKQKMTLEEETLALFDRQLTDDKVAKQLNRLIRQTQVENRDIEMALAKLENTQAKVLVDIESQKSLNEETEVFLNDILQQRRVLEEDLRLRSAELEKLRTLMSKRQKDINIIASKIEAAINKAGGEEISPEELKIRTLEKSIEDVREYIKTQQKFWLRQQGHIVSLSQQRQGQICDMDMLRKQLLLLIQKNLKVTDELEAFKKSNIKIEREISKLQSRLLTLNEKISEKREYKDIMEKSNEFMQYKYLAKLEQTEMESLKLESDITDIEEDKVTLSQELIDINREALTWEKKLQMLVEAKKNMDKEKKEGGEVDTMKTEIHRMEVRLSQLKRAQDKLMLDLEHCILRRECIITTSEAREKKTKGGTDKVRINFQRKLDDVRNQIKQVENEIKELDKKAISVEQEQKELSEEIDATNKHLNRTEQQINPTREKIQQMKIDKQRVLDTLVLKQKKLKIYSELAKDRLPFIPYKTENAMNAEYNKQQNLNKTLTTIANTLLTNYPNHLYSLTIILNTLKLPWLHL